MSQRKTALFLAVVLGVLPLFFFQLPAWAAKAISEASSPQKNEGISNAHYQVTWPQRNINAFTYTIKESGKELEVKLPVFEIEGQPIQAVLKDLKPASKATTLRNNVTEYTYEGSFKEQPDLRLLLDFQVSPDNPVLRFRYSLKSKKPLKLTKKGGDDITYLGFKVATPQAKEVRFSEFNERFHATHLTENDLSERHFTNELAFMGPMLVWPDQTSHFLVAYEHGSQFPDKFLEFKLHKDQGVQVKAVKGNYLSGQEANNFSTVWFELAGVNGDENNLARHYRQFMLKYITQNAESRKPYIFYNTWGRQERSQWRGEKYLTTMKLDITLQEIDRAHAMGVDVYVIDTGWFTKTGDWSVNKAFFPDELKQVKAKLDGYGMKLGLWFNPTVAALSSRIYAKNKDNRMSWNGKYGEPREIWETEPSVGMCLESSYWNDFADELIRLVKEVGVTYFKWDAIGQYGCNAPGHYHGTVANTPEERAQSYAFQQPLYMSKIIDKVVKERPEAIFDFDITEDGRCVGLQFLSSGKYFIINNGPYYHNFDLAEEWKSVLPSGNANIFVEPGPARGWFVRSVLDYDKWIPSVLFLSHYQPDEPRNSQVLNLASLILGQNGIWGEILKTSDEGVQLFDTVLTKYKQVRDDITAAMMVRTGETGGSPEIYEKINPQTGKGCVVLFANHRGDYTYVTQNKTVPQNWHTDGVTMTRDEQGRVVIKASFKEPSAKIIFFGVQ